MNTYVLSFQDLLRNHIKKNGFSIYSFAKLCGIDRTTIQKVLSGERKFNDAQFLQIIPFLPMTPSEFDEFRASYMQDKLGVSAYNHSICIKELIENVQAEEHGHSFSPSDCVTQPDLPITCDTPYTILNVLNCILTQLSETESEPYVHLFSAFHHPFVHELLDLMTAEKFLSISITHLVPFVKNNPDDSFLALYNIKMLSYILPFAFQAPSNYHAHYYYEDTALSETSIPYPFYLVQRFLISYT